MVKINYKDFVIEFNSVDEARYFIERSGVNTQKEKKNLLPDFTLAPIKKRKKGGSKHFWTEEEVQYITDTIDSQGSSSIARSSVLKNHTIGANKQMIWRIVSNSKKGSKLRPEIQVVIDQYHSNKNRIPLVQRTW